MHFKDSSFGESNTPNYDKEVVPRRHHAGLGSNRRTYYRRCKGKYKSSKGLKDLKVILTLLSLILS